MFFLSRRAAPWLCLGIVLTLFLFYWSWLRPVDHFGRFHDDTLYFSSAQAVAQGRGHLLPSVPGTPAQTKYPLLYPWLLSWIWKWRPAFPANIIPALWMNALFACWFLVAGFQLLRSLGLGDWLALALITLCAFHPLFLFLSGAVLSDVPFMALALTAAVMADPAFRPKGRMVLVVATAIVAGLSVMTRTLGLAVIAGILATALYRRTYRQAAVFCLAASPFLAVGLLWTIGHSHSLQGAAAATPGWRQTWLYYSSYWEFWKLSVPNLTVLWAMTAENLKTFLEMPAAFCLFPPLGGENSYPGVLFCITLTAGILAGLARQARGQGWKPIYFIFPFYSLLSLVWNYPLMDRFLQLFLPLFYAGLWIEGRNLLSTLLKSLRSAKAAAERVLAGAYGLALLGLLVLAARYYLVGSRPCLREWATERAALGQEKEQLYDWIRQHTDPTTPFIAYEDASLYLYTGRQAMRPVAFTTDAFYMKDQKVLERDLAHITDVARHIGARYWVVAKDDWSLETGQPVIEKRMNRLKSALPVVFQSRNNKVQLYDLSCVLEPKRQECQAAVPILFAAIPGA